MEEEMLQKIRKFWGTSARTEMQTSNYGKEHKKNLLLAIKYTAESDALTKVKGSRKISAETKKESAKKVVPKKVAAPKKAVEKAATKNTTTAKKNALAKKYTPKKK